MKMIYCLSKLLLVVSLGLASSAYGRAVEINSPFTELILDSNLLFYEDKEQRLVTDDFRKPEILEQLQPEVRPSFGISPSAIWLVTDLKNLSERARSVVLEIPYPSLDYIDIYEQNSSHGFDFRWSTGDMRVFETRPLDTRTFAFPIDLAPGQSSRFLIRITSAGPKNANMKLWDAQHFHSHSSRGNTYLGVFYGCLFALLMYNLALGLSTRERVYFSYGFYVLASLLFFATWNGMSYQFLWPHSPLWGNLATPLFLNQIVFWATHFTMEFLEIRVARFALLYRIGLVSMCLGGAHALLMPFLSYKFNLILTLVYVAFMCFFAIFQGVVGLVRRLRSAVYYDLAWGALLFAAIISSLAALGFLPLTGLTIFAAQIGSATEIILLSFGLGDRFNQAKKEKINALLKLRGNLEVLFKTTQRMARVQSIQELGLIVKETIESQIPGLFHARVAIFIADQQQHMQCYEISREDGGLQCSKLSKMSGSLPTDFKMSVTDEMQIRNAFVSELRGPSSLDIVLPAARQHEAEELNFIAALTSVLAISLDNIFYTEDLKILVESRTKDLRSALDRVTEEKVKINFLLDTMNIGILTFASDLLIEPDFSRYLSDIFAKNPQDIPGCSVLDLIFLRSDLSKDSLDKIQQTLQFSFDCDALSWELNEPNLLTQADLRIDGEHKIITLDWNPLIDDHGHVKKVMLCLRDITKQVQIEKILQNQNARHDRLTVIFGELIRQHRGNIKQGLFDMRIRLAHLHLSSGVHSERKKLILDLHTIKGNARILGFSAIVEAAHALESVMQNFSKNDEVAQNIDDNIVRLTSAIDDYEKLFVDVFHGDEQLDGNGSGAAPELSFMAVVAEAFVPARQSLAAAGIELEEIVCRDAYYVWAESSLRSIREILGHAFNNAADHGYILPLKRKGLNSLQRARFEVSARLQQEQVCLEIIDHGFGIDFESLEVLARQRSLCSDMPSQEFLIELLLKGGLSSARELTASSGRGVGVAAIAAIAEELGGSIRLEPGVQSGTVVTILLPDKACRSPLSQQKRSQFAS